MRLIDKYAQNLGLNAKAAANDLRSLPASQRNHALMRIAKNILRFQTTILAANRLDVKAAQTQGLSAALIDRLALNPSRLKKISQSVVDIARFPDPLGKILEQKKRRDGLKIKRISVPIGVVLFIFESRPNVVVDGAALCLKSGNAVILRGGKEAANTNLAFGVCIREAILAGKLPEFSVQVVNTSDRSLLNPLLRDETHIDLVIPRGGESLIRAVAEKSRIPVIKHHQGICHTYVDKSADSKAAINIVVNAKTQRPGVCNAMETLLLDSNLKAFLAKSILKALSENGVELFGDAVSQALFPKIKKASANTFDTEYLDLKCSVKMVDGVRGAVAHIAQHGSEHTDAIVAKSKTAQQDFVSHVNSASVMINASTRFADGGEYGLGAEVGISTGKLHARGPMGLESLTTYQWIVEGNGHVRN